MDVDLLQHPRKEASEKNFGHSGFETAALKLRISKSSGAADIPPSYSTEQCYAVAEYSAELVLIPPRESNPTFELGGHVGNSIDGCSSVHEVFWEYRHPTALVSIVPALGCGADMPVVSISFPDTFST